MDKLISREEVERLRMEYPAGIRVVLVRMEDEQAPPKGTRGTVVGVDDLGSIMVNWDNGSSLSVIYGVDLCERLSREKSVPEIIKDPGRAPRSTDETSEGLPESWSASMKIAQAMGVKLAAEDGYAVFYEERHRLGRTFKSVIDVLSINDPYFTQKFKLSLPLIYRYRRLPEERKETVERVVEDLRQKEPLAVKGDEGYAVEARIRVSNQVYTSPVILRANIEDDLAEMLSVVPSPAVIDYETDKKFRDGGTVRMVFRYADYVRKASCEGRQTSVFPTGFKDYIYKLVKGKTYNIPGAKSFDVKKLPAGLVSGVDYEPSEITLPDGTRAEEISLRSETGAEMDVIAIPDENLSYVYTTALGDFISGFSLPYLHANEMAAEATLWPKCGVPELNGKVYKSLSERSEGARKAMDWLMKLIDSDRWQAELEDEVTRDTGREAFR